MPPDIRDAASVCVFRLTRGRIEVLMLKRPDHGAFPGAWVFPGGKVDPEDQVGALDEGVVRRRAAVREAREESGLILDPSSLVLISRCPPTPHQSPAQFDTWIYACEVPPASDAVVDGSEIVDHAWIEPGRALSGHARSELVLLPPTWITLHHLATYSTADEALESIAKNAPERYASRLAGVGNEQLLLWSGDIAYDNEAALDAPGPRNRLTISSLPWCTSDGGSKTWVTSRSASKGTCRTGRARSAGRPRSRPQ